MQHDGLNFFDVMKLTDLLNKWLAHPLTTGMNIDQPHTTAFRKQIINSKPFLEKLTTGNIASILAPDKANTDDQRPVLEWAQAIRSNAVVYVGLDALTDPEVASAVGASMFSDLTSLAGHIYKHGIAPSKTNEYAYNLWLY